MEILKFSSSVISKNFKLPLDRHSDDGDFLIKSVKQTYVSLKSGKNNRLFT